MDDMSQNFSEKLDRLIGERSIAEVARASDVPWNTVSDALKKGQIPRAPTLLKIARALDTPIEYLVDDDAPVDHPPTKVELVERLGDEHVMAYVADRYQREADRLDGFLKRVEKIDWPAVAERLEAGEGDGMTEAALRVAVVLYRLPMHTINRFDSVAYANQRAGRGLLRNETGSSGELYKRIDDIFAILQAKPKALGAFMDAMRHSAFPNDPDATIEIMEKALIAFKNTAK